MDTSKTRSIKYLLLQAWRERWSDVVWGISIKSVLPRGVSGDVYDLADCILQQALVGPGPNNLFMSYLMHSLSSRVVSYGAVLSSIGRYQSFYKPYCILSLLELLKTFQSRIGCHGNEEECIALCKAIVSVTHWLYSCVYHSITKLSELKQSPEHISIMEKSYEALYYFSNSTFIKSLLYVGKFEDHGMYTQMLQRHRELEEKINQVPGATNVSKEVIEGALSLVSSVDKLPTVPSFQESKNENCQALSSTVNAILIIGAILSPANDNQTFINHLLLIKKLQNFKLSQLYCEIVRSCMIGTCDNSCNFEDYLKWLSFSFLKLPDLIAKMNASVGNEDKDAFEKCWDNLLEFSVLLDQLDLRNNTDSIGYFIPEFQKAGIQNEEQGRRLLERRRNHGFTVPPQVAKQNMERGQITVALVIRADQTLKSIMVSLESDYSKNQEPLLKFLCQILPVRNFKLILAAFSSLGTLNLFISKLIDYNEYNMYSKNDAASECRALMFDVTFIMLMYVTQYYGIDVVVGHVPNKKDTFFIKWITQCLPEGGKFKCPEKALSGCKQSVIDSILVEFLNTEQKINTNSVKWDEVIINAPAVAKEILLAWEYGALSLERVKAILDHIKGQFCFLPMCISAWMCNYVNVLHHVEQLKPKNMIHQFSQLLTDSELSAEGSSFVTTYYKDRSSLTAGIITSMLNDLTPPPQPNAKVAPCIPHGLTIKSSIGKIIKDVFQEVHYRGWLDLKSIRYFESLLGIGGARWLCDSLVRQILGYKFLNDINRAVDISIGIFYLDIEQCALALLLHVLPFYLYSETHQEQLAEPYGTALARLAVITIYAALQSRQCSSISVVKVGCKRSHLEMDIDDTRDHTEHSRPSKIHRSNAELLEDTPFELQSVGDEHLRNAVSNPINKAIADLMRMLLVIASDPSCSGRSYFPIRFLEQVVLCAKDQASAILQFMPLGLVGMLLKKYPEEFSHELILAVSSMLSPRARKVSALSLCQLTIAQNRLMCKSQQSFLGF